MMRVSGCGVVRPWRRGLVWALILGGCTVGALGVYFVVIAEASSDNRGHQLVGRQLDGSVVVTTNQILKPAGRQVEFRGRPLAVALSPDRRTAAILNGTNQAIVLVDVASWTVKQEFTAAGGSASFDGILYSQDGRKLYASQATGRLIVADVAPDGTLSLNRFIQTLPKSPILYQGREDGDPYPGGLALSVGGTTLYVVLSRNNSLAVLDLATDRVLAEIPVGNAPHAVAVHGNKAYVSNQGGRRARGSDFTNDSSGTPIVADRDSGHAINGTVSVVDLQEAREIQSIEVGVHPTALALDGSRLFVANTNSDSVSVIDLEKDRVVRTIAVDPFPGALLGSSPNALAFHDEQLVVSLGRANALALFQIGSHPWGGARLVGLVPTGWYPSSLAVDPATGRLIVVNGKGVGSLGPEAIVGPDPATNKTGKWVHSNQGSASLIEAADLRDLGRFTRQVFANNGWDKLREDGTYVRDSNGRSWLMAPARHAKPVPIPERLGQPSVFKHVFYIIKENRTYDQVFGALRQGNGDPKLVQFGRDVTPNQHAIAEQFVLFDNLYDSGSLSADGHQWVTQAFVPDYIEKSFGGFTRTYPFNGGDALAYARTGFLWDNARRHKRSVRVYGEYVNGLRADGEEMGPWSGTFLGHGVTEAGTWSDFHWDAQLLAADRDAELHVELEAHSDIPSLEAIINKKYPPYHMVIPDQYRVEVFLREFEQYVQQRSLPDLVIMALTNDHTEGTRATYPTPRAMVADNDLALGRVVEAISNSPYWKDSVIFVIEDDAQNGVDHVDGHRTIGYVISPYTKRGVVDSRYYTQIDMIRAMEQILGLPPMNQMDMAVEPTSMRQVFTHAPDFSPFRYLPNQVPLNELNPSLAGLTGVQREWAVASNAMNFSRPDIAGEDALNRAIWYATKGFDVPYPGDDRVLRPSEVPRQMNRHLIAWYRPRAPRVAP
jgi:YVTN family beta-propeller protein